MPYQHAAQHNATTCANTIPQHSATQYHTAISCHNPMLHNVPEHHTTQHNATMCPKTPCHNTVPHNTTLQYHDPTPCHTTPCHAVGQHHAATPGCEIPLHSITLQHHATTPGHTIQCNTMQYSKMPDKMEMAGNKTFNISWTRGFIWLTVVAGSVGTDGMTAFSKQNKQKLPMSDVHPRCRCECLRRSVSTYPVACSAVQHDGHCHTHQMVS